MRFLFRSLSLLALAGAIIAGTVDAIRSVASGAVALMPLSAAWAQVNAQSLTWLQAAVATDVPAPGGALFAWLMTQPAFAVLLCLSFVLYCAGYRRKKAARRLVWR